MTSYSLQELNDYIRQVIALNFTEPIWVNAEISQAKESRGSVYIDLIQHSDEKNEVVAQSGAVIWYKSYLFIRKKLGDLLPSILKPGTKVLVKVKVEYHERYGMKLVIEDIDPSFTIGQMEMARQKIIEQLKKAGVMEKNSYTHLPEVIQNMAVISSATAAGYIDFQHQLKDNEYGYAIHHQLYPAAMQGANTEREVCEALDAIIASGIKYDCIAIIRGGGSKLDLASFDNYNIGYKVATFPIPVLTGIGHEIDSTVTDIVSYAPLKTPTAVAAFIIDRNLQFESDILQAGLWINQLAKQKIEYHKLTLDQLEQLLIHKPKEIIRTADLQLDQIKILAYQAANFSKKELWESLGYIEKLIHLSDPMTTLKRGYVLIKNKDNEILNSVDKLKAKDEITLEYYDGKAKATIDTITK